MQDSPVATGAPVSGAPATPRTKRGRETAGDMLRSLGVVMVLVVVMWFLAQPPDSDEQSVRVVDPTPDLAAFTADVPTASVPQGLDDAWRPTSSTLSAQALRIGYVTPDDEHHGRGPAIRRARAAGLKRAHHERVEHNRKHRPGSAP